MSEPKKLWKRYFIDSNSNSYDRWEVMIDFDQTGSEQFTEITKQLAGTGRILGIFLDGQLLSAPTINVEYAQTGITGGSAVISSNFTSETAQEFEIQLRSEPLPVMLEITAVEAITLMSECEE